MEKYKVLGGESETVELVPAVAAVEASEGVEAVEAKDAVTAVVGSEVELEAAVGAPLVEAGKLEVVTQG